MKRTDPKKLPGAASIDIKTLFLKAKLTLRPDLENGVVDLMGWMQDISKIQVTLYEIDQPFFYYNGIFLGNQISGKVGRVVGDLQLSMTFVQSLIDEVYEFNMDADISLFLPVVELIIGAIAGLIGGALLGPLGALFVSLGTILSIDKLKSYIGDTH